MALLETIRLFNTRISYYSNVSKNLGSFAAFGEVNPSRCGCWSELGGCAGELH